MRDRDLLRRTARSFYLTVRLLPRAVRADVALAYLLARATDTVADSSVGPVAERIVVLRDARASLARGVLPELADGRWLRAVSAGPEGDLLRAWPELWRSLQQREPAVRELVAGVLDAILEGQIFDLERFGPSAPPLFREEVERYTYLVAGRVGEFWDDVCRLKLPGFSRGPADFMRDRARRYGQGLQLVNILRDRRADAAAGRVYIDEADAAPWSEQARLWLAEGAAYCADLRSGRLRYATLLPALFGWRTLALGPVPGKIPRAEVRRWMLLAGAAWLTPAAIGPLARRASK